ncbi:c-type cytochrome [Novosphingobium malaysiense]|uniref:c-type cytochrome n=1 Tax=Novosphingobium malaysiense TaxID=1348853 RepID=UPI00068B5F0C|nr:cytochrome c [Novosphingobium malaysiense]
MRKLGTIVGTVAGVITALAVGLVAFAYSGIYDVGADDPHTRPVYWLLETIRDRSVASHAGEASAPADLSDPQRISRGAGLYAEMCTGCHLAPGMDKTEMARGLYPQAPELARGDDLTASEQFWVIKHGMKASAMPAWGKTHSDALVWDMVSFIRTMPSLSPQQYQDLVKSAPTDHDEIMERDHAAHAHEGHDHAQPHS